MLFVSRIFDPEALAGDDDLRALLHQLIESAFDALGRQWFVEVYKTHVRLQVHTICDLDGAQVHLALGACFGGAARHGKDADRRDITLQQCIGGLRRAVRHQHHFMRGDARFAQQQQQRIDHTTRDTFLRGMRGGHKHLAQQLVHGRLQRNGMREGATYIDPYFDAA